MSPTCCRLCLSNSDDLESIFSIKNGSLLMDLIKIICPIPIETAEDDLPQSICQECVEIVTSAHQIRVMSVQSDFKLRSMRYRDPLVKSEVIESSVFVESPQKLTEGRGEQDDDEDWQFEDSLMNSDEESGAYFEDNSAKKAPGCHKCSHCDRTFGDKSNANRHERRVHKVTSLNPLKCDQCLFQTYYQISLTSHMLKHSLSKKGFKKSTKVLHLQSGLNSKNEKKSAGCFQCRQCGRKFSDVSNARRHERLVHNIKNTTKMTLLNCKKCSFETYYPAILNSHMKRKHSKEPLKDESHKSESHQTGEKYCTKSEAGDVAESDEKSKFFKSIEPLICDHCPYQTTRRTELRHHLASHLNLPYRRPQKVEFASLPVVKKSSRIK